MTKQFAFAIMMSFVMAFAQNTPVKAAPSDPKNSAPTPAANMPSFEITEEDMAFIRVLLQNEMFKNSFTEQCTAESASLLGAAQAAMTCQCAYNALIKNDKLLYALATTDNDDGFDKWGYEVIEPCLPEKFTPEMESAFVKQCVEQSGVEAKAVCECSYKSITQKYTVKSLIKAAFENADKLQMDLVIIAGQCAVK